MNSSRRRAIRTCPFVGLRPFSYADRSIFFGRETQIADLEELVASNSLISVIGNSGSGKSSLIRAGLLPRLAEGSGDPEKGWNWVVMRPGEAPIRFLAEAIARPNQMVEAVPDDPVIEGRVSRIEIALRQSSFGVREALSISELASRRLIILIDQFEEIFRFADLYAQAAVDPLRAQEQRDEATLFVQLLLTAANDPDFMGRIIITMRSDFIGDCARFHGLAAAVTKSQYLVPALTRDQRADVIRKPVEQCGATVDPAVVQRLLNDTSEDSDQLPVLQHAMMRIWMHATENGSAVAPHLGQDGYEAVGGIEYAISRHADEVLAELREQDPVSPLPYLSFDNIAKRLFQSLTVTDALGRTIRRPQKFGELIAVIAAGDAEQEEKKLATLAMRTVIKHFIDSSCSFLRLPEELELHLSAVVDIGHEALIRKWSRLGALLGPNWVREEQDDAEKLHVLSAFASKAVPLPEEQLAVEEAWWHERRPTQAWVQRYQHDAAAQLAAIDALLKLSRGEIRRKEGRRRIGWALTGIAGLGVIGFGAWFASEQYRAKIAAREELYTTLGTVALASEGQDQALLVALKAHDDGLPIDSGLRGLIYSALQKPHEISVSHIDTSHIGGRRPVLIAFDTSEEILAFSKGQLTRWDPGQGKEDVLKDGLSSLQVGPGDLPPQPFSMKTSVDGDVVLISGSQSTWVIDTKQWTANALEPGSSPGVGAISPDGDFLVTVSSTVPARAWRRDRSEENELHYVRDRELLLENGKELAAGLSVAIGGKYLAIVDVSGEIHIFDYDSSHFHSVGTLVSPSAKSNTTKPSEGDEIEQNKVAPCPLGPTSFLEFNPAFPGKLLAVTQGVGILWDVERKRCERLAHQTWTHFLGTFSADGQYAALSSTGGPIEVWEFNHGEPVDARPIKLLGPHGFTRLSSAGGRLPGAAHRIAASSDNGDIWTWTLEPVVSKSEIKNKMKELSGDEAKLLDFIQDALRLEDGVRISSDNLCLDRIGDIRLSEINPQFPTLLLSDNASRACK